MAYHGMSDEPNLSLSIKLPPYSPNSIPLNWYGWLRQHVLANRSFKDYDDILMPAHRPQHFIADVERVMSLVAEIG